MCDLCNLYPTDHQTQTVLYHGRPVEIDTKMVDLMQEVWKRGWDTQGSCESDHKNVELGLASEPEANIYFETKIDALRFLRAAAGDAVAKELQVYSSPEPTPQLFLSNGWNVTWTVYTDFYIVGFPPEQIDAITRKLQGVE